MAIVEQEQHRTTQSRWVPALFLAFFLIAFGLGQSVLCLLTVVQFLWLLATGKPNHVLQRFGKSLAQWFSEVVQFLSCASDDKPFPWTDWPTAETGARSDVPA